ncbi:MAG: tryptophan--tRNA ligase [candidate division Zixibacteria bacterium]|nr:tryptophan--tRNA ligase [candidate division Zixibacteria bacterium]
MNNTEKETGRSETAPVVKKETILSGMQPTGSLHIGNLEGALRNWVRLQDEYWMYCCIVDWHALTAEYDDTRAFKEKIFQMAVDYLAAGLDPDKCAVFIQSEVKEHAELHLIFSMLISVPTLSRLPTYQEKKDRLDSYGFLGYPVLQAADICLYNANKVPVGKDQEKHVWLANDLAKKFNSTYRKVFVEPEALFTDIPMIPGSDNRKMSKSYGNHIPLEDTEKETENILKKYYTDPAKVYKGDPGNPDICPVYLIHRVYTADAADIIAPPCRTGELGCVDCKKILTKNLNAALHPIRERRLELLKQPDYVWSVLETGRERAHHRAQNVMEKVRDAMKMNYRKKK